MTADALGSMKNLRLLDPERDGPALHAIFGDPESCKYLPNPALATVQDTISTLQNWTTGTEDTSWAVVDQPDGEALGRVSFFSERPGVWEVACMIVPSARGNNLAFHALEPAIDYVFAKKAARRIFADIDPDNKPSLRLFQKLGFKNEGILRAAWETHIGVRDSVIMALLKSDPRPHLITHPTSS